MKLTNNREVEKEAGELKRDIEELRADRDENSLQKFKEQIIVSEQQKLS